MMMIIMIQMIIILIINLPFSSGWLNLFLLLLNCGDAVGEARGDALGEDLGDARGDPIGDSAVPVEDWVLGISKWPGFLRSLLSLWYL